MPKKQFEGIFEVFDFKVRRTRNLNMIMYVLERPEDIPTEKRLIDFRGKNVAVLMTQEKEPANKRNIVTIEDTFKVDDLCLRSLKNGNKLRLVLVQAYEKDKEKQAVELRYENIKLSMEITDQELDFGDESEEGEPLEGDYQP